MENYVSRKELIKTLGIHYQTVYNLVKNKKIETIKVGKISKYNLKKYLEDNKIKVQKEDNRKKICYCRVSSRKQSEDLERQIKLMEENYPDYEIISDIGSGLNLKRKGLENLIELAINGKIKEVVITYKDRLARFGYDLIEMILKKYSNAEIVILNKNKEESADEEMVKDILSIMNVYVAKINGMRRSHLNKTKK